VNQVQHKVRKQKMQGVTLIYSRYNSVT